MMMFHKEYKSWYDLSDKESCQLEREFISHDMGRYANDAMHICVIIGIITFVFSAIMISIMLFYGNVNPYLFTIFILFTLLGLILVVGSTIEYHMKFNSWLYVNKRIIKK